MFSTFWHTFFFNPIYNILVFFIDVFPGGDVGLAIIATVLIVKTILLPISIKAVKTQKTMRDIEPKLKETKEKHKNNKQVQAEAVMNIYKEAGMNPLASVALVFLQIPIIIALYFAVSRGGGTPLPDINIDILYSFIGEPKQISMNFLGMVDIASKSLVLAIGAGLTQFLHIKITLPKIKEKDPSAAPNLKEDFMRNMQIQMKYVMPVLIGVISYSISAAIALYFMVSNLVTISQEYYFIKKHR